MHGLILVISAMFIQEPGYHYTEDQVGEALEKIEATMPAAVLNEMDTLSQDRAMLEHFRGAAPDVRKSMIEFARKMAYPLPGCAVTQWEWVLFMYRDPETERKFVSKTFDEGEFAHYGFVLDSFGNPNVLAMAGHYLFDGSVFSGHHYPPIRKDQWVLTQMHQYGLIEACAELPEDVLLWHRRLEAIEPPEDTKMAIYRRWWKENEAAFKTREYDKVKPGVLSIPGMKKSMLSNPPEFEETAQQMASSAATNAAPINGGSPLSASPPVASTGAESATPSTGFLGICAGAAIALLGSLIFFWKRRA